MNIAHASVSPYKTSLTIMLSVYREMMTGTSRSTIDATSFSVLLCAWLRAASAVNAMYDPMHMTRAAALKSPFRAIYTPIAMKIAAIKNEAFGLEPGLSLSIPVTAQPTLGQSLKKRT